MGIFVLLIQKNYYFFLSFRCLVCCKTELCCRKSMVSPKYWQRLCLIEETLFWKKIQHVQWILCNFMQLLNAIQSQRPLVC